MRKGNDPSLHLEKKGDIFAIATGSDFCAEHEGGSKDMQQNLCMGQSHQDDSVLIQEYKNSKNESEFNYSQILERKRINKQADAIRFIKSTEDGVEVAAIIFDRNFPKDCTDLTGELHTRGGKSISGAWDEDSFGFKVVGPKLIAKLEKFHAEMVGDGAIFAGIFLKQIDKERLTGVIIAIESKLRPEHMLSIKVAQREYEENIRLQAGSRITEFRDVVWNKAKDQSHIKHPGHMWPMWKDHVVDSEVVYGINPDYDAKKLIPYFGPYTFDTIKDWMLAEKKYPMVPYQRVVTKAAPKSKDCSI